MKNTHRSVLLMLVLQSMICTAQESKASENEAYRMQEIPSLQNIIARNILIDFNNKIDENTLLSQDDLDGWIDYLTNHQILFKDVINDNIHSQDNQTVIKKGDLLFKSVRDKNTDMTQLLLAAGANVNIQHIDGWTLLHQAATNNSAEIARMLIDAGTDMNTQDKYGWTSLHSAAAYNSVETACMLIDADADLNIQDEYGKTPLQLAASNNSVEIIRMLIDVGANVNLQDIDGWTPLHSAVVNNDTEIISVLIDAGADFNIQNNNGKIAEQLVENQEIKALFIQARPEKGDLLLKAARENNIEMVQLLLAAGANVNIQDESGRTPLYFAVTNNRVEIVRMLIDAGGNLNLQNNYGETPLHNAAYKNQIELARILIGAGTDLHIKNNNDKTAQQLAYTIEMIAVFEIAESLEALSCTIS